MTLEEFAQQLFAKRNGVGTWEWECWILGKRPQTTCAICKKQIEPGDDALPGLLNRNVQRYWFHRDCMTMRLKPFAPNSAEPIASINSKPLRWPDGSPVMAGDLTIGQPVTFDLDTGEIIKPPKPE